MDKVDKNLFRSALNDLIMAQKCMESQLLQTNIACYHCYQCAEKSLKGFLYLKLGHEPKSNNLTELLKLCIMQNIEFTGITELCEELMKYSTVSYDVDRIDTKTALSIINDTQNIYDLCFSLLIENV
ncbi:MAG: HEPN domain-containing protein [Culturomica sp.]|jgi:HEPN domain-containing protein|nr:HEPN domain-containing protein [Culturomica sp.]